MRNTSSGQSGVAIVEVLICSVIVAIAAVGLALMLSSGQAYIQAEGDNRVALFLSQQKIEQLRAKGYAGLAVTDDTAGPTTTTVSEDPVPNHPGDSRTWSVVCVDRDNYSSRIACSGATSPGTGALQSEFWCIYQYQPTGYPYPLLWRCRVTGLTPLPQVCTTVPGENLLTGMPVPPGQAVAVRNTTFAVAPVVGAVAMTVDIYFDLDLRVVSSDQSLLFSPRRFEFNTTILN